MHVLGPVSVFEPVVMGGPGGPPADPDIRRAAQHRLQEVVSNDTRIFSHVTDLVTSGKAYREILREAAERRVDLIVMGAHGGRLGLAAFGSTTGHVVREAACPVLTLRA
jgi:nucleotide-binding universal stress UspA family protein